ncbi:alpha/beta fold hydrolase [Elstera litoralis]|uniref:alpha/beta fold hydrolase n=1 Tax=Elstera litoralis TaxID=552518 RepID=UPI0009FBCF91|nr:alpha/beta fold hydrolase [Elstera litoralis]
MNSATPVVFLHGLGLDHRCWRPQIDALRAQGIACHAWEMPGHGGAPWDGQPMSFSGLAASLSNFLDAQSIPTAHLVGHSMGGMLALALAATAPARCRSLTLIGSSAMFGSADGSFQRAFLAERLGPLDAGQRLADLAPGPGRRSLLVDDRAGRDCRLCGCDGAHGRSRLPRRARLPRHLRPTRGAGGTDNAGALYRWRARPPSASPGG